VVNLGHPGLVRIAIVGLVKRRGDTVFEVDFHYLHMSRFFRKGKESFLIHEPIETCKLCRSEFLFTIPFPI